MLALSRGEVVGWWWWWCGLGTTEYILNLWPELLATSETGDFRQHLCKIKDYHHNIDKVQARVGRKNIYKFRKTKNKTTTCIFGKMDHFLDKD